MELGVDLNHKEDCIFCKISQGLAPCFKVHEDELTLTFLDVFPAGFGHLLIIPKAHFSDIFSANPVVLARIAENSVMIAGAVASVINPDGLGIHQLNREAAGQTVFHYHVHLIPQTLGVDIGFHSKSPGNPVELKGLAEKLREAVENRLG
jgi:histidine triad (HIT) family protein